MIPGRRWTRIGLAIGVAIAVLVTVPQARADLAGIPIMGPAEGMVILSLPMSLVTWGLLLLVLLPFKSDLIPPWLAYLWLAGTPIVNWTLLGWLLDRHRHPPELTMRLLRRLDSIESKRARLLDRVEAMDPAVRSAHPRPGKWSILEIVEHLVICEGTAFSDPGSLAALPPLRRRPRHRFLFPVVMFVLRFDIPVQAPSKVLLPTGALSLEALRTRWEANHAGLRQWLTGASREELSRSVFSHPIGGPMTPAQMLWMVEVHLDRHIRQIDMLARLIDRVGIAAPGTVVQGSAS